MQVTTPEEAERVLDHHAIHTYIHEFVNQMIIRSHSPGQLQRPFIWDFSPPSFLDSVICLSCLGVTVSCFSEVAQHRRLCRTGSAARCRIMGAGGYGYGYGYLAHAQIVRM